MGEDTALGDPAPCSSLGEQLEHMPPQENRGASSKALRKSEERYMELELELLPEVGVGPLRLGMSVQEIRDVVPEQEWGASRITSNDPEPGQITLKHAPSGLSIVLGFTRGALSGVELFRFRDEDAEVHVSLDGLDVFRTPSADLLEQLAERGHEISENDLGFDALPGLKVILANQSSYEHPVDEDGGPLYYDYVRIADRI
ncbi:hypothetical protein ACIRF8_32275 [Streptomyces sp. NPDC102406]|uniref:hypothetical protein n=1 Tax=Streptomyces sp. NPDC102406 TaxID=3366171 RepID=UPI00380D867D